jgi:hypothetical protein
LNKTFYISLPYATFGVVSCNGKIVSAAPIARWVVGKTEAYVLEYYRKRKADVVEIK